MKKSRKITLIIAFCLIFAGLFVCTGVLFASGFDLSKMDNTIYTTNTYDFREELNSINISCDTADVSILPSENNSINVTCFEDEDKPHTVTLEEGTLTITSPQKHWYDYIRLFSFRSPEITLYLPEEMYTLITATTDTGDIYTDHISSSKLALETSTGHITIDNTSYAEFIGAEVSTGNITIQNTICGTLNTEASTGGITLLSVKAMEIEAENSTGDINLINTTAERNISAQASTGDIIFEASDGNNIFAETSTGDIKGTILTTKTFNATTDTGKVSVPDTQGFGMFEASASTGDINISYTTE